MKIRLTEQAANDLKDIRAYYFQFSNQTGENIIDDINAALDFISENPNAGLNINAHGTQRVISHKYSFVIPYEIMGIHIDVLGFYRFQNRDYS